MHSQRALPVDIGKKKKKKKVILHEKTTITTKSHTQQTEDQDCQGQIYFQSTLKRNQVCGKVLYSTHN